jgi:hypothetical protein
MDVPLSPLTCLMPLFFPGFVLLVNIADSYSLPKTDFNVLQGVLTGRKAEKKET